MKYKPGGYTGFLTAGQIPSFCSFRKHIVVIFAHANRLLVMDYITRDTALSVDVLSIFFQQHLKKLSLVTLRVPKTFGAPTA